MLTPFVLADYSATVTAKDESDVLAQFTHQSSTPTTSAVPPQAAGDSFGFAFSTQPDARLVVHDRRSELTLGYTPLVLWGDVGQPSSGVLVLHNGSTAVRWHDRTVQLGATGDATYGQFNSAFLPQTVPTTTPAGGAPQGPPTTTGPMAPPTAAQPAPPPQTVTLLIARVGAQLAVQADRHTSVTANALYLDTESGGALPGSSGPRFDASVAVQPARALQLVTRADAQESDFTQAPCVSPSGAITALAGCSPQIQMAGGSEGVVYGGFERATTLAASLGVSFARSRGHEPGNMRYDPVATYPTAEASVGYRYGAPGQDTLRIDAQLGPVVSFLTGLLNEEAQAAAAISSELAHDVTLHAALSAAQTVPLALPSRTTLPLTLFAADSGVDLRASRLVTVSVGERAQWQKQDPFGVFFTIIGYCAVTVGAPALRF